MFAPDGADVVRCLLDHIGQAIPVDATLLYDQAIEGNAAVHSVDNFGFDQVVESVARDAAINCQLFRNLADVEPFAFALRIVCGDSRKRPSGRSSSRRVSGCCAGSQRE